MIGERLGPENPAATVTSRTAPAPPKRAALLPALRPTAIVGRVIWPGVVGNRDSALGSAPRGTPGLTFTGAEVDAHRGLTRRSRSRVTSQPPTGTAIRDIRQLCIMSAEELSGIAAGIGIMPSDAVSTLASVVVSEIPDVTRLPPSSRLQAEDGATLFFYVEKRPFHLPAPVIDASAPGRGRAFKAAARGRRGITARVEREGHLRLGGAIRPHLPDQTAWRGA